MAAAEAVAAAEAAAVAVEAAAAEEAAQEDQPSPLPAAITVHIMTGGADCTDITPQTII